MQPNFQPSSIAAAQKLPATISLPNDLRPNVSAQDVSRVLDAARGRTIVVVGDVMLDEWIIGAAQRISPEAPVPILRWSERRTAPGGAANVAMNLLRLGARVAIYGVIGDDEAGRDLAHMLREAGANIDGLVQDRNRPTTLKTRIVAQHQQVVRIDRESDAPISQSVCDELQSRLQNAWKDASALCLSDYDKGLAACGLFADAIANARQCATTSTRCDANAAFRITGGPKPHNLSRFAGADFLSLNQKEASEASEIKLDLVEAVEAAGEALRHQMNVEALTITRGSRGVALFTRSEAPIHLRAHEVEVFDVAGAGDTFLAAATIALAGGADFCLASEIGNLAAAASVRHTGVVAVSPAEVLRIAEEN